jgi:Fic/DOC family
MLLGSYEVDGEHLEYNEPKGKRGQMACDRNIVCCRQLRTRGLIHHRRLLSAEDWTARELGIAVHAETVRIHPFIDGNGRTTRLLADLAFLAAQGDESLESYDWAVDKDGYIALLREYDRTRDLRPLATFIPVTPLT